MMTRSWGPVVLAAAVVYGTAIASGQSNQVKDLGIRKLVVSSRGLPDPNFVDSVVLLIQYDRQGTVGVMINRRSQVPISRILQDLNTSKHGSDPIYIGGPVEMTGVLGLFRSRKRPENAISVLREIYLVSNKAFLEKTLAVGG